MMIIPCCHVSGYVTHYFEKDSDRLGPGAEVLGGDEGVEVSSLDARTLAPEILVEMVGVGGGYWVCGLGNCVYKPTVGVRISVSCVISDGQLRVDHN